MVAHDHLPVPICICQSRCSPKFIEDFGTRPRLNQVKRASAPHGVRAIVFDGVRKEKIAALAKIITAATDSVIANLPLRPTRVKRHLSSEREWSILGYGPIVRVVHRLTPWYDRRDDQSAVITAADGTLSTHANGRSPARSSHDLFPYFGDDWLTRAEKSAPAERGSLRRARSARLP